MARAGGAALLTLIPSAALPAFAAEDDDEVMSLPPLLVEERLKPLRWRFLEAPGLEVLSLCDDPVTRGFFRQQDRLNQVLHQLVPARFQGRSSVPDIQLLFNEDLSRAKSQEVMQEMLKRDKTQAPGVVARSPSLGGTRWELRRVYFLPNLRLNDIDATAIFAATREYDPDFAQFTFVADRIRYLLERRVPALPDWFVAGTVGLYERVALRMDGITVEPASWISEAETRALAADENWPRTLWPMQELLAARRPKPGENEGELAQVWRAQCALFVRWAVVENDGARKEALWTLVDRLDHEPLSESLFRECLGLGFADVRDRLSDYLPVAVAKSATLRPPKLSEPPDLKLREASVVEIARIRGDWERMQISYVKRGFPELTQKYVDQARTTLDNAYGSGERDPRLLAIIGLTECDAGNPAGARAYLEAAARAGVVRPRVYLELARQRFAEQVAIVGEGQFSAAQVATVLEPLRTARTMDPPLPEALGYLAETLTRGAAAPSAEDLAWLNEGVARFPRFTPLVIRTIYLNANNGRVETAIAFARAGQRAAGDAETRQRFERALTQLAAGTRRE